MPYAWSTHKFRQHEDPYEHFFNFPLPGGKARPRPSADNPIFVPVTFPASSRTEVELALEDIKAGVFRAAAIDDGRFAGSPLVRVAELGDRVPAGDKGNPLTIFISAEAFEQFEPVRLGSSVDLTPLSRFVNDPRTRIGVGLPLDELVSGALEVNPPESSELPPYDGTVVTGVIDSGIGFAHERFLKGPLSTRIEYFTKQEFAPVQPVGFFGTMQPRELSKASIDRLLARHSRAGLVDEEAIYRATGHADFTSAREYPAALRASHGTHVMDLACGYDYRDPAEREKAVHNPIIAVQLNEALVGLTEGVFFESHVGLALDYIAGRVQRLSQRILEAEGRNEEPLPFVVNYSFGDYAGRHDGFDNLESIFDDFLEKHKNCRSVTIAAGNSFQTRTHARLEGKELRQGKTLCWKIQPDDRSPGFVQIWLPHTCAGNPLDIEVVPPDGPPSGMVRIGLGDYIELSDGRRVDARIYAQAHTPGDGGKAIAGKGDPYPRIRLTVVVAPTMDEDADNLGAPSGDWLLRLRATAKTGLGDDEEVTLWIERSDSITGFRRRGRQSHFEEPDYERFVGLGVPKPAGDDRLLGDLEERDRPGCAVRRFGTLTAVGTGVSAMVVGGYRRDTGQPAQYSSAGPITPQADNLGNLKKAHRSGPDFNAVAEDSRVLGTVLAAGTASGSSVAFGGTSIASAQAARRAVEILQTRTATPADSLRKQLAKEASARPIGNADNRRTGAGNLPERLADRPGRPPRREA